jgi:hypothetical protein
MTLNNIFEQLLGVQKEKTLEEKAGAFSVIINSIHYGNKLLSYAKSCGLSIPKYEFGGHTVDLGLSSLSFLFEGEKDVNFIDSAYENLSRNLVPRLIVDGSIRDDYLEARRRIAKAGEAKKALRKSLKKSLYTTRGKTYLQLLDLKQQINEESSYLRDILSNEICGCPCYNRQPVVEEIATVAPHYIQVGNQLIPKSPQDTVVFID